MKLHKIFKGLAPIAALAGAALVSGCDGVNIQIGDKEGVPLADLDLAGKAPTELVLASPDEVIVTEGDTLDIAVSGDDEVVDSLRFSLDDDTLGIHREKNWKGNGIATVRVTMPSLRAIVLAGSGTVQAASMRGKAEVTVAGSGSVKVTDMAAERLDATIAGSGDLEASGTADSLDLTIAGSGEARMAGLTVERADVSVAGSGDAEFASDGKVEANIVGSGDITVNGRANCTVSAMGSGKLNCRTVSDAPEAKDEPDTPAAPEAPEAPEAPAAPEAPDA